MYFKRIDIQGFKSFAEPVSIEFHEGITCIVGPNGSGKSNIADAIRWVLGEQSPKMLRGGKMEEVIFAGTANRKSRGMAEVTLTIDNTSEFLPIDYSEVAITRRMYRSGESGYFINKVPCRLRDIRELIMDTGIGVDGYSIIGQGRIADILSDKPEGRREIFEEAAGIVKYRSKKEESERKLEASQSNLDRVNDIVGEIESRIDGLREDSVKAKEYLELRERYKKVEVNITLKNVENLELKNEYIKDDISELINHIEESRVQKESIDADIAENRTRNEELETLSNTGRDRLLALVEEINTLSNQNQLRQEKLSAMEKDRGRLQSELESFTQRREKEEGNAAEFAVTLEKIQKEYESLKLAEEEKGKEVARLESEMAKTQLLIDSSKDKIYEFFSKMSEKRGEINSLSSLKETLTKRKEQVNSESEDQDTAGINLQEEYRKALASRDEVVEILKQQEQESLQLKSTYSNAVTREKLVAHDLGERKVSVGQLAARLKMIGEMENAYEGYNEAVKFIMRSELEGLHGVVADLIHVPKGFERAVETALGAALQNIVCRDDRDAQGAIRLLKSNRVGRLTFLPLSSIRSSATSSSHQFRNEAGFKGLGVDCVEFDSKYKRVMDYLLSRVVIVEKLEDAVRMSKLQGTGGLRFVSLDGDVVNASGAITGGAYRNKTAGLLERKAEAKNLEERLQRLQEEQEQLAAELADLAGTLEQSRKQIEVIDAKHRETEMALLNRENELSRMSASLSNLEDSKSKRDRELSSIENEEKSAEAMIEELQQTVANMEQQIAEAEMAAEKAMESSSSIKKGLDEAKEALTQTRLSTGAIAGERNNAEQILKRIQGYIEEYKEEAAQRKEALATLEEQKNGLFMDEEERMRLLTEKEADKLEIEESVHKAIEEKRLVTRYLDEIQAKRETLDNILSSWQTDKHELELKLAKNETQVEGYKEKLWEDFEISYLQAMDFQKRDFVMSAAVRESREIKNRMKELGEVNIGSIKEYESVSERYEFLTVQRDDLLSAMDSLVQIIEDMDRNIRKSFKESFDQVVVNFEQTFQSLFGGGVAELRLEDESRPLETGIDIVVQPPGKKLQNINLMSGGEKTLTAIALMFAILKTKPTPFCILDEVEAALDETNIDRFARYLRDFKEIQFTLVTHQKATMEYADVLYGVTMPERGISKVISLKLGDEIDL